MILERKQNTNDHKAQISIISYIKKKLASIVIHLLVVIFKLNILSKSFEVSYVFRSKNRKVMEMFNAATIKITFVIQTCRAKFLWMQHTSLIYIRSLKRRHHHTTATYFFLSLTLKISQLSSFFTFQEKIFIFLFLCRNKYIHHWRCSKYTLNTITLVVFVKHLCSENIYV